MSLLLLLQTLLSAGCPRRGGPEECGPQIKVTRAQNPFSSAWLTSFQQEELSVEAAAQGPGLTFAGNLQTFHVK